MQYDRTLPQLGFALLSFGLLYGCDDGTSPGASDTPATGGYSSTSGTGGMANVNAAVGGASSGGSTMVSPSGAGGSGSGGVNTAGPSAGGTTGTGGTGDDCVEGSADCGCTEAAEQDCIIADESGACSEGVQACGSDGTWSECSLSTESAAACKATNNCNAYVGITYDDGPVNTDAFVDALSAAGLVPVTFFVNGSNIRSGSDAIERMLTVGEVQSHAFTHTDLGSASVADVKSQLERNNDAIMDAGAPKPTIFRPPYGTTSANTTTAAAELDMLVITWDADSQDWSGASPSAIVRVNDGMKDGDVILMHESQNNSLTAIPDIAAALQAKGFCPGKLDPQTGRAVAP